MPREIIALQVGQCGNQIGCRFWQTICEESELDPTGKPLDSFNDVVSDKVGVYYHNLNGRYVPRAVLVDLEPGTTEVIKASPYGSIFKADNFAFGQNGAGNNWAKGHYTEGAELVDKVLNIVRKEAERCDAPQGFQICHSLGGGTGSGMGTLLLLKIRDAYPDRITKTYSVYPSPKVSDTVVEPYNAVLSSHQLLENADETFVVDNEALYDISTTLMKAEQPNYADLNYLICRIMSGVTASIRFPGKLNGDLRKLGVNLVPFPRLHFFTIAEAPIQAKDNKQYVKMTCAELTKQVWSGKAFFAKVNASEGKYLTSSVTYRGAFSTQEVDNCVRDVQAAQSEDFVEWIPNNIKSSVVLYPGKEYALSCTFVCNTTALKNMFQRLSQQFTALYKRKAFLHWYKGEGMDEMEFQEADKNVVDLITEYQDKQDAVVGGDEDEGDDDI